MPRYFVVVDPDTGDPETLFRTPDQGGPPTEAFDPDTGEWNEDVSLLDYFTGDDNGAVEIPDPTVVGT